MSMRKNYNNGSRANEVPPMRRIRRQPVRVLAGQPDRLEATLMTEPICSVCSRWGPFALEYCEVDGFKTILDAEWVSEPIDFRPNIRYFCKPCYDEVEKRAGS